LTFHNAVKYLDKILALHLYFIAYCLNQALLNVSSKHKRWWYLIYPDKFLLMHSFNGMFSFYKPTIEMQSYRLYYVEKFNYRWNLCHSLNILIVLISNFIDGDLVCLWCVYFHHYWFFSVSYFKYELAQNARCFCALFGWRSNLLQMQMIKWVILF